ncbi:TetR/AcrR family transcriptional regulator [uncultured Massilia sp.]|uniref:TetR/AcrR family transcriptional regulator n=1 Tax=uncultured Massilia sp. TaxID=169973 RepID=UPI0025E4AAF0|nr:TetR family transcriptional regulator [uncultured Massilia sp.]
MASTSTPRSRQTRERILEAARTTFAAHGYDGATLRNIALQANTNVALVIRYFGSKDDLFATAVDFDLQLPPLQELDRERLGELLVAHFLAMWEDDRSGRELVALLRAAASHAAAKARMQQIFHTQLLGAIGALGFPPQEAVLRASLVASQMLGFALVRYVLAFEPPGLDGAALLAALGRTLQRYLAEPLPAR